MAGRRIPGGRTGRLGAFRECLLRSYGDLADPKRHFVGEVVARQPYADILTGLAESGEVNDDTDVNCDVSFTYIARRRRYLTVRLSMVGPYAAILSSGADGLSPFHVISARDQCEDASEQAVFDLIDESGFKILSDGELREKVPIRLRKGGPVSTIYAAFFEPDGRI
jgi:hypothetical protein